LTPRRIGANMAGKRHRKESPMRLLLALCCAALLLAACRPEVVVVVVTPTPTPTSTPAPTPSPTPLGPTPTAAPQLNPFEAAASTYDAPIAALPLDTPLREFPSLAAQPLCVTVMDDEPVALLNTWGDHTRVIARNCQGWVPTAALR
jgi:hypothetical protein